MLESCEYKFNAACMDLYQPQEDRLSKQVKTQRAIYLMHNLQHVCLSICPARGISLSGASSYAES